MAALLQLQKVTKTPDLWPSWLYIPEQLLWDVHLARFLWANLLKWGMYNVCSPLVACDVPQTIGAHDQHIICRVTEGGYVVDLNLEKRHREGGKERETNSTHATPTVTETMFCAVLFLVWFGDQIWSMHWVKFLVAIVSLKAVSWSTSWHATYLWCGSQKRFDGNVAVVDSQIMVTKATRDTNGC